jgi:hypothetical protein
MWLYHCAVSKEARLNVRQVEGHRRLGKSVCIVRRCGISEWQLHWVVPIRIKRWQALPLRLLCPGLEVQHVDIDKSSRDLSFACLFLACTSAT